MSAVVLRFLKSSIPGSAKIWGHPDERHRVDSRDREGQRREAVQRHVRALLHSRIVVRGSPVSADCHAEGATLVSGELGAESSVVPAGDGDGVEFGLVEHG